MNQEKIGKFIAECRKSKNLTQMQLAEKLNITDRAVSKWETGKSMPDSSIMLELCEIFGITVNDLLCGEVVTMDNYNKESEKILLEMVKQKEQSDKRLLIMEIVIGLMASAYFFPVLVIVAYSSMEEWLRLVIILLAFIPFIVSILFALKIEQTAGYYECKKCHHRYVPTYKSVFLAPHINRTRYMKCPECNKSSWNKKVISKNK
ncbi:MAG: helix-turn-helix transcriptional regulator [Clostridia bacterium]|nr:helix-turn-helix transcriptional regulator [Clostridia bacterium]